MFRCWRELEPLERFKWGQKGASLVHSAIMALVGMSIVISGDWNKRDLVKSRDERVAAFLGLEIGYLLQVSKISWSLYIKAKTFEETSNILLVNLHAFPYAHSHQAFVP